MLTPDQIDAIRTQAGQITDPITDFLIRDIARRVSEAGQLTSTAAYQVWQAQKMGLSQQEIKKRLQKLLKVSAKEIEQLLTQSAEVGYRFDLDRLPTAAAIPFEDNAVLQQIVTAAVDIAQADFTNLTQTMGMVDPYGNAQPLQKVYRQCTDFAFKQVSTGAADYNTAIRQATRNLVKYGVRTIDYESGVHTSLEAAVRRNIMGGLGLMQERINEADHDMMGCDGWEISAHANSAPDHEPFQGRQYSDAEYQALNNSLVRRIGTLNCGHAAFPIILGVSSPQYTPEELEKLRADNAKGVTVNGKHYTGYEATQKQREIERAIRKQKWRIAADEAAGDSEKLRTDKTRLTLLRREYRTFSKAAGLRQQNDRLFVAAGSGKAPQTLANSGERGIISASHISSPIERGNKGDPAAITHFDVSLNKRQTALLKSLPGYNSRVTVKKKSVSMKDLAALTAKTGEEFAMFTKGGERFIVRGNSVQTPVSLEEATELAEKGYRWSGHTHPGMDDLVKEASGGDLDILSVFAEHGVQNTSVIYDSLGRYQTFVKFMRR